jgi:hypothetical protein
VRSAAEIDEGAVLVGRDLRWGLACCVGGRAQVVQDLDLVGLAELLEVGTPSVRVQYLSNESVVRGHRGGHTLLDAPQILRRERARELEVVVEAALDGWADAQLGAREEIHHGLRHDVRRGVTHRVEGIAGERLEHLVGGALGGHHEVVLVVFRLRLAGSLLVIHGVASWESKNPSSI